MAGCMYQNYGHSKLLPFLTTYSATDVSGIIAGTSNPLFQSLSPQLKQVVIEQITEVMSNIWAVMIAGAALNVLLGPFLGVSNPCTRQCVPPGDGAVVMYMLLIHPLYRERRSMRSPV
jgi:hypothetical protein